MASELPFLLCLRILEKHQKMFCTKVTKEILMNMVLQQINRQFIEYCEKVLVKSSKFRCKYIKNKQLPTNQPNHDHNNTLPF